MGTLYVSLYPGPKSLVNAQILSVHHDRWDVRLSASLNRVQTLFVTFWLDPVPVNCHVRIIDECEDPVTGELRASFYAIDLDSAERLRLLEAMHGVTGTRLRCVS